VGGGKSKQCACYHFVVPVQDKLPLLQNLVAAGVFCLSPMFKAGAVDLDLISNEGQKKQDAKDTRDD